MKTEFDPNTFDKAFEVEAMLDFLESRWNIADIKHKNTSNNAAWDFIHFVYNRGCELSKNWISQHDDCSHEAFRFREKFITKNYPEKDVYDDVVYEYLYNTWLGRRDYANYGTNKFDFGDRVQDVLAEANVLFDSLSTQTPNGYPAFIANYDDFDGQEEYCNQQQTIDESEFHGTDASECRSFPFPATVAMPYVAYDDLCQGRKPIIMLVSAILAQGLGHTQELNNSEIKEVIKLTDVMQPFRDKQEDAELISSDIIKAILDNKGYYPKDAKFVSLDLIKASPQPDKSEIFDEMKREDELKEQQRQQDVASTAHFDILTKHTGIKPHNRWLEMNDVLGYEVSCYVIETQKQELHKIVWSPVDQVFFYYGTTNAFG